MWIGIVYTFGQTLSHQRCVPVLASFSSYPACGQSVDLQLFVLSHREMRSRNEEKLNILSLEIKRYYA